MWRNGAVPDYVGRDAGFGGSHPVAGLESWWAAGAPGPGSGGVRWDGSRGYTNIIGPGKFPPIQPPKLPAPTLTSSARGLGNLVINNPGLQYEWQWPTLGWNIVWAMTDDRLFKCWPGVAAMWAHSGPTFGGYLRCTAHDPVTGISTWVDPAGSILSPGESLQLISSAGPGYPS